MSSKLKEVIQKVKRKVDQSHNYDPVLGKVNLDEEMVTSYCRAYVMGLISRDDLYGKFIYFGNFDNLTIVELFDELDNLKNSDQ